MSILRPGGMLLRIADLLFMLGELSELRALIAYTYLGEDDIVRFDDEYGRE